MMPVYVIPYYDDWPVLHVSKKQRARKINTTSQTVKLPAVETRQMRRARERRERKTLK